MGRIMVEYTYPLSLKKALTFNNKKFNNCFVKVLKEAGKKLGEFYIEFSPITKKSLEKNVKFYIISTSGLSNKTNRKTFSEYLDGSNKSIVSFTNFSGDSILVVPNSRRTPVSYNHIGSFVKHNSKDKIIDLWKKAGNIVLDEIKRVKTLYLSTHGHGVAWLHIRIDRKPKYFKSI